MGYDKYWDCPEFRAKAGECFVSGQQAAVPGAGQQAAVPGAGLVEANRNKGGWDRHPPGVAAPT